MKRGAGDFIDAELWLKLKDWCRRLTRNEADAEDLAQDTLKIAWEHLHRGNTPLAMWSWLKTIAWHHWCRKIKRDKRLVLVGHYDDEGMPWLGPSPFEMAMLREILKKVQDVLEASDDAEILARAFEQETRDYKKLAEELKLPASSIRTIVFRFRARLRELFPDLFKE